MSFQQQIYIEEQGLRDGLQTFDHPVDTALRLKWMAILIAAGVKRIQIGSFVSPKLVPMMAVTAELFHSDMVKNHTDILFSALTLNTKGVELAVDAQVKHLATSLSASNTHSLKNAGKNIEDSKIQIKEMLRISKQHGVTTKGGIQCAFGCRYEGAINQTAVLDLVKFMCDEGVDEISLADSTGMGNPSQVEETMYKVKEIAQGKLIGLHLHNTENKGYANLYAGLRAGVNIVDTAFGGLGGCPFIKGATGNIATEDTIHMLEQMGVHTGIDIKEVSKISKDIEQLSGERLSGFLYKLFD